MSSSEDIICKDPSPYLGQWRGESKECVALPKDLGENMRNFATYMWKRGLHVQSNYDQIAQFTAIATFEAPNNKYLGHAAIFDKCDSEGIWVYDQWNARPVNYRRLNWDNTSGNGISNNGSKFYTIRR